MTKLRIAHTVLFLFTIINLTSCIASSDQPIEKPNIVFILADDLGYGDISCYNENSKIKTPSIDELASSGIMFTDAHTNSSVCTPTRYGILTGRYSWRSRLKKSVLYGYDKALIPKERLTLASLMKTSGYETAAIGKWHLGWDWANVDAGKDSIDYSRPISNGPTSVGFDYFYGIIGSLSMPPYVWVENDLPTMVPTKGTKSDLKQSIWLEGEISDDFIHEEVLPETKRKAVDYINTYSNKEKPFFLYLPLTAPHNPILPSPEFQGKSGLDNPYPDFVMMVDGLVSEIVSALKQQGVYENTILIFISDNGCSNQADFDQLASKGHFPSYIFRGYKSDLYEGGHRVPFVLSWPNKIKPGITDHLMCTTDFLATFAELLRIEYPDNAGEDSFSFVSALGLPSASKKRESIVHHSFNGSFAYRQGNWKICMGPDSGGWSDPKPGSEGLDLLPKVQLYNLENDIAESNNVQGQYPGIVENLRDELKEIVQYGRSTPGEKQKNDGAKWWEQLNWMTVPKN